jgi:hypothetical protein
VSDLDKPNLRLPLAISYNTRGTDDADLLTRGSDQRKINSLYDVINNSGTGKATLYLVKRPGVNDSGATFGLSGQVAYLVHAKPGSAAPQEPGEVWVFSTSGNDIRASNSSGTTTVIVTAAGYVPTFVDKTAISGTDTLVLQLRNSSNAQRVFFSSAIATFTEITDGDFTGLTLSGKMEFMDGYAFALATSNRIYNSDLNSLANWTPTNFITKQIQQDEPRGLMRFKNQIIACGAETMEVFGNAGNATGSPLQTVPSLYQRIGLDFASGITTQHYYAIIGTKLYFKGALSRSGRNDVIFSYDGEKCEKVSTPPIEKTISGVGIKSIQKFAFYGRTALALRIDTVADTTQRWLMFFPDLNEWFEWNSTVFMPICDNLLFLGVGANQHKLYEFDTPDLWRDAGTDYTMTHQFKLPRTGNHRKRMPMFGVIGDMAASTTTSALQVRFSDDDWQTSTVARPIDMTKAKKHIYRCGAYNERGVYLDHTANLDCRLEQVVARIEE